jgi:hypothetical protein
LPRNDFNQGAIGPINSCRALILLSSQSFTTVRRRRHARAQPAPVGDRRGIGSLHPPVYRPRRAEPPCLAEPPANSRAASPAIWEKAWPGWSSSPATIRRPRIAREADAWLCRREYALLRFRRSVLALFDRANLAKPGAAPFALCPPESDANASIVPAPFADCRFVGIDHPSSSVSSVYARRLAGRPPRLDCPRSGTRAPH